MTKKTHELANFHGHRSENHKSAQTGWLRAAVLGANDGIVSTASLIVGVAAAHSGRGDILLTGVAGLVAGAMSMAAGEYVSVSSQADTEEADLEIESEELKNNAAFEEQELAEIYVRRGLTPGLAAEVAAQLTAHDALGAHARDELGITDQLAARPVQAALASAASFATGAALPIAVVFVVPLTLLIPAVSGAALLFLALLGLVSAHMGGAKKGRAAFRVLFWGAFAMALTAGIGSLFGATV